MIFEKNDLLYNKNLVIDKKNLVIDNKNIHNFLKMSDQITTIKCKLLPQLIRLIS